MAYSSGSNVSSINAIDWFFDKGFELLTNLFKTYDCKVANTGYPSGSKIPEGVPTDDRGNAFTTDLRFVFPDAEIPLAEFPEYLTLGNGGYGIVHSVASKQLTVNQPSTDKQQFMIDKLHWATESTSEDQTKIGRALLSDDPSEHKYVPYVLKNKFDSSLNNGTGGYTDEVRYKVDPPKAMSYDRDGHPNHDDMPARTTIIYRPLFSGSATRVNVGAVKPDLANIIMPSSPNASA